METSGQDDNTSEIPQAPDQPLAEILFENGTYKILPHQNYKGFQVKALKLVTNAEDGSPMGIIHLAKTEKPYKETILYLFIDGGYLCHTEQSDDRYAVKVTRYTEDKYTFTFLQNILSRALSPEDYRNFWTILQNSERFSRIQNARLSLQSQIQEQMYQEGNPVN